MSEQPAKGNVCFRCGKIIKGKMVYTIPSAIAIQCGDFEKAWHPACYKKQNEEAAQELKGKHGHPS
mgnify:CR=1 FL=1